MYNVREWLEALMQLSNERGGPETLRKELLATVEDVLAIQAPSFDPWVEPLLSFEVKRLEKVE